MHCEQCASLLEDGDKFCGECGAPVVQAQKNHIVQFNEAPVVELEEEAPEKEPWQAPGPKPKPKSVGKPVPRRMTLWERFLGGLIAALLAVVLFLGAYWIFGKYANPPANGAAPADEGKYSHGLYQQDQESYKL